MVMDDVRPRISAQPVRFFDRLRLHIRQNGLAFTTEKTYVHWVRRFICFHQKRHPQKMGSAEVEHFLTHLSQQRDCSVNTQRVALNALVYLYKCFIGKGVLSPVDRMQPPGGTAIAEAGAA
ncbi:phage integrase N-terminal SAM-like domain-containing protein [Microbulbifer thermotolerans]|uniref:site-specific integrase n=1 Tax=Microbulbifer thermotolerans TaxID=252514 RepID=UPI00224B500D|nr:site-specific integrase [Microbulbifer thermotolerans]MCX2842302.1 phage integrase N-terminal SAM-like domain-containing protein [Microbulbifer thermotolerans]